ncbi:MAG: anion permease [Thermoproteales archaeon]|nr:anion permease [Thermoproteales archaeon]
MEPVITFTLIFIATMLLLIAELEHKVVVALLAAVLTIYFGVSYGLFSLEDIPEMMELDTLFFIVASFILFQSLESTGLFDFLSLYIVKKLKLGKKGTLLLLLLFSVVFSMVSSNYVVAVVMANVTLYMARMYDFDPREPLMIEGVLANLGGLMLPISSIPGLIVSVKKGIGFLEFIKISGPLIAILTLISLAYYIKFPINKKACGEVELEEGKLVDKSTLYRSLLIFISFIVCIAISDKLGFSMTYMAFVFVVLMFMFSGLNPAEVMSRINWEVPFFIGGFAIFVNGLESSGILGMVGEYVKAILTIESGASVILLVLICGFLSALIDNVPVVLLLLPIVDDVVAGLNLRAYPLYWSLIIGSGVGGGLTIYGSVPVLTMISIAERKGYDITVSDYSRKAAPLALLHLIVSAFYLWGLARLNIL